MFNFLETTDPIHYYIPASAGEAIELRINGTVWCGSDLHPGSAGIDWLLYDLTLKFYGEELSIQSSSLGTISAHILWLRQQRDSLRREQFGQKSSCRIALD